MIQVVNLAEVTNAQAAEWLVDLAEDLRPGDLDEIKATSGEDPAVALVSSVMVSDHAWMVLDDNEDPIAVFGCAPEETPGSALVWMLGSPKMDEPGNALGILRRSVHFMDLMHRTYPVLWNYIDDRNERSMKWLQWCGFSIIGHEPHYGVEGRPFSMFMRLKPSV